MDHSENEQDWQPVQIAPPDQSQICATNDEQRRNCVDTAGKIIRVRRTFGDCVRCGGKHLIIHPEDFAALNLPGNFKEYARTICESQVLAD